MTALACSGFRRLRQHELQHLPTDSMLRYLGRARSSGEAAAAQEVVRLLAWRHRSVLERRVGSRVPRADVEDVSCIALAEAMTARFHGRTVPEHIRFLSCIADRAAADFYRRRARRPIETVRGVEFTDIRPSATDEVRWFELQVRESLEECLRAMRPEHRRVAVLHVLRGWPAAEVALQVPELSAGNVQQIGTRFREALRLAAVRRGLRPEGSLHAR